MKAYSTQRHTQTNRERYTPWQKPKALLAPVAAMTLVFVVLAAVGPLGSSPAMLIL